MAFLLEYQWIIFILLEISSLVFLILFGIVRYGFGCHRGSTTFLILFFTSLFLEAILAYVIYNMTGEITSFQVVIIIFLIYALTFGINDFKRLDRYMKQKIGAWRDIDLLTEEEKKLIIRQKDPKYLARQARIYFYIHTGLFLSGLIVFWFVAGNKAYPFTYFFQNFEWFQDLLARPQPFTNDMVTNIVRLWTIIYVVDSIVNWSYTLFPDNKSD